MNDTSDNLDKKKYLRDRKKADVGNLMDIIVAKLNEGCPLHVLYIIVI